MTTQTNKDIVERFDSMLNTRDFGDLDAVCTPDMVNHSLRPDRPKGLEGTRQWLETEGAKFQDFRWQQLIVVGEDDLVVQFGVRGGEWPGGMFRGFDVPAGPYTRDTAFMYRVTDGRISERWAVNDHLAWLLQRGAIPTPTRA